MTKRFAATLFVLAAAVAAPAAAAETDAKFSEKVYEGIRYYSGGVSIEERQAMPQRFPLKIVFATDKGNLLCNADVTVTRKGQTVFQGRAENGPWLFVDLPPGTYDIRAVQDGSAKSRKGVKLLAAKGRTVRLRWRTKEVDMGL